VAPAPFAKSTPIEVTNALQHNQLILVSLAVSMNASSQAFYMENGKLGWPVPSLKQLFFTAVAYKKKFKKGIISSWEDYKDNYVSIFIFLIFMQLNHIYEFIQPKYLLSIRMTNLGTLFAT
jgi:hypothetical protein